MNPEKINNAIKNGHAIAVKMRKANTYSDISALSKDIKKYCDYVNNTFGKLDELSETNERYSKLSLYLALAFETKERHMRYPHDTDDYGNEDVDVFEEYLDSKEWF